MIALRKSLTAFLKTIHPRAYFQEAPSTAVFPYLVFDFQLYPDGEGFELCTLSVDGWSKNPDTTELENLMTSVKTLDKTTVTNPEMAIIFYLENMLPLIDDDKTIKRRQYNFSGKLFRKG
ncbi:hypothetical protein [Desulfosporosinus meridiei]|uniref:Uncharacterized protein n=1 Tax=Desulfosporosinus meridiei (strain ATCC BAA-275 / DSM 13257 / KCTC 12902 / NCIMB 13706 / S10) TaxID=768704 RepID=J7J1N4_DESMD|nr:hypothetical protein [Desulfosporosinus meridiei]AFQ46264.1 hypothetical protein Desmer_4458 [Desulfosporosinus meridiei DSM 13257]